MESKLFGGTLHSQVWKTREGRVMSPVEMEDGHLLNASRQYIRQLDKTAKPHWDRWEPIRGMSALAYKWFKSKVYPLYPGIEVYQPFPYHLYLQYHAFYKPFWCVAVAEIHRRRLPITEAYSELLPYLMPLCMEYVTEALNELQYPYKPVFTRYWSEK